MEFLSGFINIPLFLPKWQMLLRLKWSFLTRAETNTEKKVKQICFFQVKYKWKYDPHNPHKNSAVMLYCKRSQNKIKFLRLTFTDIMHIVPSLVSLVDFSKHGCLLWSSAKHGLDQQEHYHYCPFYLYLILWGCTSKKQVT